MTYAINVCDLLNPEMALIAGLLLGPVTPDRQRVRVVRDSPDTEAVILQCDEARARAIVDTIRTGAENRKLKVRCYEQGPKGGWREAS